MILENISSLIEKSENKLDTHEKVIFLSFHPHPPGENVSYHIINGWVVCKYKIVSLIEKYEKTFWFVKK